MRLRTFTLAAFCLGSILALAATVAFAVTAVLAGRTTLLMRTELYATPVLLGCILYAGILNYFPDQRHVGGIACILGTFALRAAAIHWNLSMPAFARLTRDNPN